MTTPQNPQPDDWQSCPQGELQRMVGDLRSQRRRETLLKWTNSALVVVLVALAGLYAYPHVFPSPPPAEGLPQALSCKQARELAGPLLQGKLDSRQAALVKAHLEVCPPCHTWVDKHKSELKSVGDVRHRCLNPACPHCRDQWLVFAARAD